MYVIYFHWQLQIRQTINKVVFCLQVILLLTDPNHERALKNKAYYEAAIADNADNGVVDPIDNNPALFNNHQQLDGWRGSATFKTYESLCRGEDVVVSCIL